MPSLTSENGHDWSCCVINLLPTVNGWGSDSEFHLRKAQRLILLSSWERGPPSPPLLNTPNYRTRCWWCHVNGGEERTCERRKREEMKVSPVWLRAGWCVRTLWHRRPEQPVSVEGWISQWMEPFKKISLVHYSFMHVWPLMCYYITQKMICQPTGATK